MKQDHFTTAAEPESASARNRQRDGVQGSERSMRGLCMCFDKIQRKAIHA